MLTETLTDRKIEKIKRSHLKVVDCRVGPDCKHWIEWRCGYPGAALINERRDCGRFEQNYDFRREELLREMEKGRTK